MFTTYFDKLAAARWSKKFWKGVGLRPKSNGNFNGEIPFSKIVEHVDLKNKYTPAKETHDHVLALSQRVSKKIKKNLIDADWNAKSEEEIAENLSNKLKKRKENGNR